MDIEVLSSKDHIEKNIYMYAGDISNKNESIFVFDEEKFKTLNFNGALVKIYSEIIDNTLDRILNNNVDKKIVYVNVSGNNIVVTNCSSMKVFGAVRYHGKKLVDCCVPKYVIEESFSSTKFNNQSNTIGIHGLGIKILPVICKDLRISICDGTNYYEYIKNDKNIISNSEKNCTIKSTLSDTLEKFFEVEYAPYDKYISNDDTNYYYKQRLYECLVYSSYIDNDIDIIFNDTKLNYSYDVFVSKFLDENYFSFNNLRCKYLKDKITSEEIEIDIFVSLNKKK